MKRIFISGPMSGIENYNVKEFSKAANALRDAGYFVINPAETFKRMDGFLGDRKEIEANFNEFPRGRLADAVIEIELALLRSCDEIYLLNGWEESRGARRELQEALEHGLIVKQEMKNNEK